MVFIYTLFFIACFATGVISNSLIKPCKLTDSACINKSVQEVFPIILSGIPSLGIETSDPLFVNRIEGKSSLLKYVFSSSTIIGYKSCKVSDVKLAQDLKNLHYVLDCDKIKMSGKYEISGSLGDYEIITGKYNVVVDATLETYDGNDRTKHIKIKNFILKSKALSPIKYDFKNNKQTDLLDSDLVQQSTWYESMKKVISNVNKYLNTVPLDTIIIN